jgi:hypothetical protein
MWCRRVDDFNKTIKARGMDGYFGTLVEMVEAAADWSRFLAITGDEFEGINYGEGVIILGVEKSTLKDSLSGGGKLLTRALKCQ